MTPRPRIGLAFPGGCSDPQAWSGIPYGLAGGLRSAGAEVVELDVSAPAGIERALALAVAGRYAGGAGDVGFEGALRRGYSTAFITPTIARLRTQVGAIRVRGAGHLNGIVQISTAYELPPVAPLVTFEDMTIPQALKYPYAHWRALGSRGIASRLARQGAVYARADSVAMSNSWAAASAIDDYGVAPEKVHVVGMGTNQPLRETDRVWSTPRMLFVGREWERKNGPEVVEAFAEVRRAWPDARLDVVGGHPTLDAPGVHGHGFLRLDVEEERDRLRGLFDRATCFVMPSRFEPSAIVYAEALAAGIPSLGTSVGGSADIIGDAGIVVDPGDPAAIREAMSRLANPTTAAELGRRARDRAPQFTWAAVAGRLLETIGVAMLPEVLAA
jgi:glycosyltransferase involved in cell wall biosynthesis